MKKLESIDPTQLTNVTGGIMVGGMQATLQAMSGTTDWGRVRASASTGGTVGGGIGRVFGQPGAGRAVGTFFGATSNLQQQYQEHQPQRPQRRSWWTPIAS